MKDSQNEKSILVVLSSLAAAGGSAGVAVATAAGVAAMIPAAIGGGICLIAYGIIEAMK